MIALHSFKPDNWDVVLDLANQAVPFALQENEEWLEYRKAFDESNRTRRHYLAYDGKTPVGYGALEQQGDAADLLRVYVVTIPDNLKGMVGDTIYAQLLQDAHELGATTLWVREFQDDKPICEFFTSHGFVEDQKVTLPDYLPMVILKLVLFPS
ncbi:MAG: GNAT family N-acetyltransferase [Candidatus Promineifilaceae bacterium]